MSKEHNGYLNEVATYFSSSEEQQRIVGDIEDLRREIIRIEDSIAAMTRQTSSEYVASRATNTAFPRS